jgi:hypothetical protein
MTKMGSGSNEMTGAKASVPCGTVGAALGREPGSVIVRPLQLRRVVGRGRPKKPVSRRQNGWRRAFPGDIA